MSRREKREKVAERRATKGGNGGRECIRERIVKRREERRENRGVNCIALVTIVL